MSSFYVRTQEVAINFTVRAFFVRGKKQKKSFFSGKKLFSSEGHISSNRSDVKGILNV